MLNISMNFKLWNQLQTAQMYCMSKLIRNHFVHFVTDLLLGVQGIIKIASSHLNGISKVNI